jgi:hypothetical protein
MIIKILHKTDKRSNINFTIRNIIMDMVKNSKVIQAMLIRKILIKHKIHFSQLFIHKNQIIQTLIIINLVVYLNQVNNMNNLLNNNIGKILNRIKKLLMTG